MTEKVLAVCMKALADNHIYWEGCLLKPNMVTKGSDCKDVVSSAEIGYRTALALSRTVPPAMMGIMVLHYF